MADPIRIDGLDAFVRRLRTIDAGLPKLLRLSMNEAADLVVGYAKPKVPTLTGTAAGSIRVASTTKRVRVRAGGSKAPYYPWLDFGGRVGPHGSIVRPVIKDGRYIYAAFYAQRREFGTLLTRNLLDVVRAAGIEVN